MDAKRVKLYSYLNDQIGRTPLVKYQGDVPNGNTVLIKRECDNPFGSHYDRVSLALFHHLEESGRIVEGDKVIETTSGSAGVSFAGIGKLLGFDCFVIIPAGGEKAREEAILEQGGKLIFTPAEQYVNGFPVFLRTFLAEHRDYHFFNHSMGSYDKAKERYANNQVTLASLAGIAEEALTQAVAIDYFVPAVGNGSSVLGPGIVFQESQVPVGVYTRIIAFETFQSAVMFEMMFPGQYKEEYGLEPGTLSRHQLPGTSFQGIDFPHIESALERSLVDEVVLVSDQKTDNEYLELTGGDDTKSLPHWDSLVCEDLGRTSIAGIAVALEIAKTVRNKTFLVIGYDKSNRYDS